MKTLGKDFDRFDRVLVFGNSGSGKSTLSERLAQLHDLAHLDLDTLAFEPDKPGVRRALGASLADLSAFVSEQNRWVIEGCYADLLEAVSSQAKQLIFLNPGVAVCQSNCRNRPWEPHKYASPQEQDANLAMLLEWVAQYDSRDDEFSRSAHQRVYAAFSGTKAQYQKNLSFS